MEFLCCSFVAERFQSSVLVLVAAPGSPREEHGSRAVGVGFGLFGKNIGVLLSVLEFQDLGWGRLPLRSGCNILVPGADMKLWNIWSGKGSQGSNPAPGLAQTCQQSYPVQAAGAALGMCPFPGECSVPDTLWRKNPSLKPNVNLAQLQLFPHSLGLLPFFCPQSQRR